MPRRPTLPEARCEWAYFLDVDGTLVDLAATPDAIRVGAGLPGLLRALYRCSGGAVALVSGRALSDLDRHLPGLGLPCAAQHGLERRDASGRVWRHGAPAAAREIVGEALAPLLARHRGLVLEDKGLTVAIHYRLAPQLAGHLHGLLRRLVAEHADSVQLQEGKYVIEIKPIGIDKGSAVREYLAEAPFLGRRPVFVGDDVTDERGFEAVNSVAGLSVKVGTGRTHARFRLPDIAAVHAWLAAALEGAR